MKKLHRGGSNPDGEPLSAGRVEYLAAARQRVRRRRLRRTAILLARLYWSPCLPPARWAHPSPG